MGSDQLTDGHGRRIRDLRVSVTDRCNFRCQYCMPADGLPWLDRDEVLRFEELERLVRVFAGLGVESVRLTGGEPLVRRDFPKLVAMLARVDGLRDLSLTTNGYLLERDADALVAAGLRRINISVDSLQRDRFFQITRRDSLPQVLRGIDAAAGHPRLRPIKLNAVALRGFTEQEVVPFAEYARRTGFQVRFIEFMPLDADHAWSEDSVLTGDEVRALIERVHPLEELPREPSATARVFRFRDGGHGEIGFVNPVSEPFCADCDRVRLTSDGKLRTCLFSLHETDLRGPLREGAGDSELAELIRGAVWRKELKHRVGETGFRQPPRTMSAIGG
ncbi:MAG: GTP 3',8-cyclase MoaA [Thermoleophilaceae bacterium]